MIAGFHDPRTPDNGTDDFTNKIFYTRPADDLPANAPLYFTNSSVATSTWLKEPSPGANFTVTGLSANCGGLFTFTPNVNGIYRIALDIGGNGSYEDNVDVLLSGNAIGGVVNKVLWDGKNGLGATVATGTIVKAKVTMTLATSEVHFPFIDVESNINGIKILRLSSDYNSAASSIVYWNDAGLSGGVPPNPLTNVSGGQSSNTNGHIWSGTSALEGDNYGNNKMLDTWAYVGGSAVNVGDITLCRIIAGNVFPDRDGMDDGKIDNEYTVNGETKIDGWEKLPAGLYAVLVGSDGKVVASVPVESGTYMFTNVADNSNYRVILTNQSYNTGDTAPTTSSLPTGWSSTGEGRGSTSDGNVNGIIVIGNVGNSTGSIRDANFGINNKDVLPVNFGGFAAKIVNGQLLVNWTSLTETNNSYFEVQASKDGENFTTIGKVDTKATNGNSSTAIQYDFAAGASSTTGLLGLSVFALAFGALAFNRKNKMLYTLAIVFGLTMFGAASCTKNDLGGADSGSSLFVRIKQVDKDGTFKYSKVVKATVE